MKNLLIFMGIVFVCGFAIYFPVEEAHGWGWAAVAMLIFEILAGIVFLMLADNDFFDG